MDCSTPGLLVHHQLPEFTQTPVHGVSDAIQPSILSSVIPFSSHLQSFPASGSFQMRQFFASGGQSIWSFSFNISPSNEYFGFRLSIFILLPYETTSLDSTKLNKSRDSISHQLGIQVVFSPCSSQAFPTASLTFPITNLSQLAWYLISYFIITSSSKSSMSHTMGTNSIDVFLWNTDYLRITRFEQTRLSC